MSPTNTQIEKNNLLTTKHKRRQNSELWNIISNDITSIREYKREMEDNGNNTSATQNLEETEDDKVIFEAHETIEDIVNQLFEETHGKVWIE